jgi:four helix bundle protein
VVKRFEDLIAWQKARLLSVAIYKAFEDNKDYGFKDQIQRSSVSVMNNIAEGFERKTKKEFSYFLSIAKGSYGEVRSMLVLSKDLKKLSTEIADSLLEQAEEISKIIAGLMNSLK